MRRQDIVKGFSMIIKPDDLAKFKEICRKICLNIPHAYRWEWDPKRNMAVIVLRTEDAELVFFPLFKEFLHHWNFSSPPPEDTTIIQWINGQFGLMPGQFVFTSTRVCDLVLCVAWWPWGEDQKVSMRIGLIPADESELDESHAYQLLHGWLDIADNT